MTDLLSIPLKKATEVDVVKPLKNTIATLYSSTAEDTDIQALADMRGRIVSLQAVGYKTSDMRLATLELLCK